GNITLTDSQQSALDRIISFIESKEYRVFILKGFAGTGKTTMVKAIIKEIAKRRCSFTLLASTGRAAKVLSDATRHVVSSENREHQVISTPAKTIHSQIYTFSYINQDLDLFSGPNGNSEVETDNVKLQFSLTHRDDNGAEMFYIVDESSMISDAKDSSLSQAEYGAEGRLLKDLLDYDAKGKFLFIGDTCQLPPINQSFSPALNKDYILNTFGINADESELTEVVRQSNGNDITLSAARIRQLYFSTPIGPIAKFPLRGYKNIHILKNELEMLNMYLDCIKYKDYSKATMIVMTNKTVKSISNIVRPYLGFHESLISVDDLLLVTQNNMVSGLMNGDLVKVRQIGRREKRAGLTFVYVEVESLANKNVYGQLLIEDVMNSGGTNITPNQQTYLLIDYHKRMKVKGIKQNSPRYKDNMRTDPYLNALRCVFGYALTCHKSQGGEWDKVFLMIPRGLPYNNPRSYAYQWVYTAMTRAKKELYVLDDYWVM
ncbi:MAG: ATP-dependent RecD-like DNA helicase, partial [Candidatus Cryptobacteroides sp.]